MFRVLKGGKKREQRGSLETRGKGNDLIRIAFLFLFLIIIMKIKEILSHVNCESEITTTICISPKP